MIVTTLFFCALFLLIVFWFTKFIVQKCVFFYYVQKIPGPPSKICYFGNLYHLHNSSDKSFQLLRRYAFEYYPIYKMGMGLLWSVKLLIAEDIGLILSDTEHMKKSLLYVLFKRWLESGLITSFGEKWVQRRKMITPAFHFTILQDFVLSFNEQTEQLVKNLKREVGKPHTEINEILRDFTQKVMAETAMGITNEKSDEGIKYRRALNEIGDLMMYRMFRPYLLFDWIYVWTSTHLRELKLVKIMHSYTKNIIEERQRNFCSNDSSPKKRLVFLDLLLSARKEGNLIDNNGIKEEVNTFMFGGHDTISTALSFGLMLIASHPKIQEKIVEEMHQVLGDITQKPSYNDLQNLKYMERCIKEILRIYPPVPHISRHLGKDLITHNGYKIKKNATVDLHIYDLHRDPRVYPDPERFDPDRFLPENCKNRHPYAYIPFSAGPRNCIGQKFAMLEMKAAFCGILGNFVLQPVDTSDTIILITDIMLRTKESIKVKFLSRTV